MTIADRRTVVPTVDSRQGWRSVAGGFVSMFTVFGVAYSFGAFFGPMGDDLGSGRGATSLVFSLTAAVYFGLGAVSGAAVDRFGPRPVLLVGATALGVGLALTSQVNSIVVGYLTYGVGVGIGVACGYVPMLAVIGGWFERRRSTALGIGVAGIGVGTVAVAPLAAVLIDRHGWRAGYAVFAVAGAALMVLAAFVVEGPPAAPVSGDAGTARSKVRTPAFLSLYGSAALLSLALFQAFVYLADFAEEELGSSSVAAAALISVLGGASVVGRLVLGPVADRVGRIRTYRACFFVMGLSFLLWLWGSSYPVLIAFAVVLGVAYGGFIALSPAVTAEVFGTDGLGAILGLLYTGAGIGVLIGPPVAGALIDATDGYRWAIAASMVAALASWAALLPLGRSGGSAAKPGSAA